MAPAAGKAGGKERGRTEIDAGFAFLYSIVV
jgi:hypothetical protein